MVTEGPPGEDFYNEFSLLCKLNWIVQTQAEKVADEKAHGWTEDCTPNIAAWSSGMRTGTWPLDLLDPITGGVCSKDLVINQERIRLAALSTLTAGIRKELLAFAMQNHLYKDPYHLDDDTADAEEEEEEAASPTGGRRTQASHRQEARPTTGGPRQSNTQDTEDEIRRSRGLAICAYVLHPPTFSDKRTDRHIYLSYNMIHHERTAQDILKNVTTARGVKFALQQGKDMLNDLFIPHTGETKWAGTQRDPWCKCKDEYCCPSAEPVIESTWQGCPANLHKCTTCTKLLCLPTTSDWSAKDNQVICAACKALKVKGLHPWTQQCIGCLRFFHIPGHVTQPSACILPQTTSIQSLQDSLKGPNRSPTADKSWHCPECHYLLIRHYAAAWKEKENEQASERPRSLHEVDNEQAAERLLAQARTLENNAQAANEAFALYRYVHTTLRQQDPPAHLSLSGKRDYFGKIDGNQYWPNCNMSLLCLGHMMHTYLPNHLPEHMNSLAEEEHKDIILVIAASINVNPTALLFWYRHHAHTSLQADIALTRAEAQLLQDMLTHGQPWHPDILTVIHLEPLRYHTIHVYLIAEPETASTIKTYHPRRQDQVALGQTSPQIILVHTTQNRYWVMIPSNLDDLTVEETNRLLAQMAKNLHDTRRSEHYTPSEDCTLHKAIHYEEQEEVRTAEDETPMAVDEPTEISQRKHARNSTPNHDGVIAEAQPAKRTRTQSGADSPQRPPAETHRKQVASRTETKITLPAACNSVWTLPAERTGPSSEELDPNMDWDNCEVMEIVRPKEEEIHDGTIEVGPGTDTQYLCKLLEDAQAAGGWMPPRHSDVCKEAECEYYAQDTEEQQTLVRIALKDYGTNVAAFLQGLKLTDHQLKRLKLNKQGVPVMTLEEHRCLIIHIAIALNLHPFSLMYAYRQHATSILRTGLHPATGAKLTNEEQATLREMTNWATPLSAELLGLVRLEVLSKTSIHIISGLEDGRWRLLSIWSHTEGRTPKAPGRQILLKLSKRGHYTLLDPTSSSNTANKNQTTLNIITAYSRDCI